MAAELLGIIVFLTPIVKGLGYLYCLYILLILRFILLYSWVFFSLESYTIIIHGGIPKIYVVVECSQLGA